MMVLVSAIVLAEAFGLAGWTSSRFLRDLASRLLAQAGAIEARNDAKKKELAYWRSELEL